MFIKISKNWVIIILILATLLSAIATYMHQTPLPAYIDVQNDESHKEPENELPELDTYINSDLEISFDFPLSWQQVIKDGNITYIAPDGTYLMFQKSSYHPQLNNATELSVQNDLLASGLELLSFDRLTTSSILLFYQGKNICSYEYVIWDRQSELRLIFSYDEETNTDYQALIKHIFDSLHWIQQDPIPEDLLLIYNEVGNFEFAVPVDWNINSTSTEAFSARNSTTGAILTITVAETDLVTLQDITQIQYSTEAIQSRGSLFIRQYAATDKQITAESVYSQQGEQMFLYHIISLGNNGYQYEFLLDAPLSTGESDYQIIQNCLKFFRIF